MELLENELPMVLKVLSRATSVLGVGATAPTSPRASCPAPSRERPPGRTWRSCRVCWCLRGGNLRRPPAGDHEMESMRQLLEETSGALLECIGAEPDAPEACACRDRMEWK